MKKIFLRNTLHIDDCVVGVIAFAAALDSHAIQLDFCRLRGTFTALKRRALGKRSRTIPILRKWGSSIVRLASHA